MLITKKESRQIAGIAFVWFRRAQPDLRFIRPKLSVSPRLQIKKDK